jgi:hypothetical protein
MGSAFYAEQQIHEWARDPELVMFSVNWSDKEDHVCHRRHVECDREDPHLLSECGRFVEPAERRE